MCSRPFRIVFDDHARRVRSPKRQEATGDPILELDDVRTPLACKLLQPSAEVRRITREGPCRRPPQESDETADASKNPWYDLSRALRNLDLLDEVANLPQAVVHAKFVFTPQNEQGDSVPPCKSCDQLR